MPAASEDKQDRPFDHRAFGDANHRSVRHEGRIERDDRVLFANRPDEAFGHLVGQPRESLAEGDHIKARRPNGLRQLWLESAVDKHQAMSIQSGQRPERGCDGG